MALYILYIYCLFYYISNLKNKLWSSVSSL